MTRAFGGGSGTAP